jgi:hypothetical protein
MASALRRERHIAYPSCSSFPGAAIVRSPLLLMRQCRWPARRRGASLLWREDPPPLRSLFPWWHRDRICSPLWGSGIGGVDVFLAPRRAALALRRERPLPPPPVRSSFPWLSPFGLVASQAARVFLSPSWRRIGRCEASDFVADVRHLILFCCRGCGGGGRGEVAEAVSMSSSGRIIPSLRIRHRSSP